MGTEIFRTTYDGAAWELGNRPLSPDLRWPRCYSVVLSLLMPLVVVPALWLGREQIAKPSALPVW
jgi:hypothetical protein